MSSVPTRWGICCAAKIATDFVTALKTLPASEHKVVAIAARNHRRAQDFANRFSIDKVYGNYEDLAKDINVDVVYIGSITSEHYKLCTIFLNARKNVLCEKPLCINLKQGKELFALAKQNKVFLMEAVWSRFFPSYERIRKEISTGTVGSVKLIVVNFCQNIGHLERITSREQGGGSLLDLGIYCIQLITMVYGNEEPIKIVANGFKYETGVDENCSITLMYSNGRMAQINAHSSVQMPYRAYIGGSKGYIELDSPFHTATKLIINGEVTNYPLESQEGYIFVNSFGLKYEAMAVRDSLLKGELENKIMSHSDSERILQIMDETRRQMGVTFDVDD